MKKILFVLMLVINLVSCSDQENIKISYGTSINVNAAHIFDSFQAVSSNDFNLSSYNDWNLNLIALIYDNNNCLVEKYEVISETLDKSLSHELNLIPGKYKLVSIARFGRQDENGFSPYWIISGESNLSTLTISEVEDAYMQFAFETLGIKTQEFTISNAAQNINIDVPPVTGLLGIFLWGEDLTGLGINGYSEMSPYCQNVNIWATQIKQQVKFNGTEILYDYGVQNKMYQMANFSPKMQYVNEKGPDVYNYRALLPISGRDFYWDITFDQGKGALFGLNDYQESDYTDKLNIESGKQYVLDLLLDGKYLFASEHVKDESMTQRKERLIAELNAAAFNKIMDRNFDAYIGTSQDRIIEIFGNDGYISENSIYYFSYDKYVNTLAFVFDTETSTVKAISLMFTNLNSDFRERMISYLSNRFVVYEKGTDEHTKAFINGDNLQSSSIGITWNVDQDVLTYVKLQ